MIKSELKSIIKECISEILSEDCNLEDIVNEDKSDIARHYSDLNTDLRYTHKHDVLGKIGSRPKITDNMSDRDKNALRYYDHKDNKAARNFDGQGIEDYHYYNDKNYDIVHHNNRLNDYLDKDREKNKNKKYYK